MGRCESGRKAPVVAFDEAGILPFREEELDLLLDADQIIAIREDQEFEPIGDVELFQYGSHVMTHGGFADAEAIGDFLVLEPFADE